jgi:FtsZ-binding cell division protein ZapB
MTNDERINTITVLELEVEVLESKVQPHATGHIITAIGVLKSRIEELRKEDMKEKYGRAVETIHVGLEELG